MTIRQYGQIVLERWKTVSSIVLIALILALVSFLLQPATYTARISLYVSAQLGVDTQQAFQGAQLSEQRVKSYTELVTSERVLGETTRLLGLSQSAESLGRKVDASSSPESVLIQISASDPDPSRAAAIANTIGSVMAQTVSDLERPSVAGVPPTVTVRIVQPAAVPVSASSLSLEGRLYIGLLAGLALGVVVALIRNASDNSVKSVESLSNATGAPNLGVIPENQLDSGDSLAVVTAPRSPTAEAYRATRTNLKFIDVDNLRKVFVVSSAIPAEGKTTTVANLAAALSSASARVLIIEGDMRRPRLSKLLGLDRSVGLANVLSSQISLTNAIQAWSGGAFDVLSSGRTPPNPSELLGSNQMSKLLVEARRLYDVVLIDSPPLLPVTDAAAVAPLADGAILVCRYKQTSISQIKDAAHALTAVSAHVVGTVLTMVPERDSFGRTDARYRYYYNDGDADMEVGHPGESTKKSNQFPATQKESGAGFRARSRQDIENEATQKIRNPRGTQGR